MSYSRLIRDKTNHRLLMAALLITALLAPILPIAKISPVKADPDKIVYVAIAVDTEGPVDLARNPPTTDNNVALVMDSSFRNSHTDSFGTPFKITWYDHMSALIAYMSNGPDGPLWTYKYKDGTPAGVSGPLALLDNLHKNWPAQIAAYGDDDGYHHHFMKWTGTGPYGPGWDEYDAGPSDPSYTDHMDTLDHMILDDAFFPTSWRSGWLLQTPALSSWLEQWIPFDLTPSSGTWYPWHPSGMNRWQTTCEGTTPYQSSVNAAFAYARDHGSALYSFYCHEREDMKGNINALQGYLNIADADETNYPGVKFQYVTAKEAMQKTLGFTDLTPPEFTVTRSGGTYTITSNEQLWVNHPYIALKYANGKYMYIPATPAGTNKWTVTPDNPKQFITEENVAVRAQGTNIPIASATAREGDASLAIDGIDNNPNNYWGGGPYPSWLQLNLGSVKTFGTIKTHFYDADGRNYNYYIEVSNDASTWTQVTTDKQVVGMAVDNFSPQLTAQYIRIWVTHNSQNQWCHIEEVYVSQPSGVTASYTSSGYAPELVIDGIESTSNYWQAPVPAWLQLDLRSPVSINKITTHFYDGDSRSYYYYIEASTDGSSWTPIVGSSTDVKSGSGSITNTFPEITTRYVRITVPYPGNTVNRGAHIEELKIYHTISTTTSTLDKIGVAANDLYGNAGVFLATDQAASIQSSNSVGTQQLRFSLSEKVFVSGNGFTPNTDYDLYIVQDVTTWTDGTSLNRILGTASSVHSDSSGNALQEAWPTPTPGKYDIVIDVNKNHKYDSSSDVLFSDKIEITAGFFVIPEYAVGTILALGMCFAGVAVYGRSKNRKRRTL